MADPPLRAQPTHLRGNASHQFVGVQTALHQHFAFGCVDHLHGLCCGGLAMRDIDQLEPADIDIVLERDGLDL